MLLHDVMDDKCEKITVQLNSEEVTEQHINHLYGVLKDYEIAGKQRLEFTLRDATEKIELTLPSRELKVNVSSELLERLDKENIRFKIN
jgi:DNA polymerase-3 subunit alpha